MSLVDVGDVLPEFGFVVTSNVTALAAAPTTFAVVLTAPDGTTPSITVTNPSTGVYAVTYVAAQAGRYVAVGTASGNNCDGVSTLTWDVTSTATSEVAAVSVEDLRTFLNAPATSEDQLRRLALVATELAEAYTGRAYRKVTVTGELHDGGRASLVLRRQPVLTVSAVTCSGTAVTGFVVDAVAGVLHRDANGSAWPSGRQNVAVTYTAGTSDVPARAGQAIRELCRHLWQTQRGGSGRPRQQGAEDDWDARMGYAIPRRVAELLDADRLPGFG